MALEILRSFLAQNDIFILGCPTDTDTAMDQSLLILIQQNLAPVDLDRVAAPTLVHPAYLRRGNR